MFDDPLALLAEAFGHERDVAPANGAAATTADMRADVQADLRSARLLAIRPAQAGPTDRDPGVARRGSSVDGGAQAA